MGYAKERGKFEILSKKIDGLAIYDDKSLKVITDIFEQYSHSIRILKNKNPEAFSKLYTTELEQVKVVKRALKESDEANRQTSFEQYKSVFATALNNSIQVTKEVD